MFWPKIVIYALVGCLYYGTARAKHGVIGMGITMYKPFCCNACDGALSSLYLACTEFTDGKASTSTHCRTSNDPWLRSFATCLDAKCLPHPTAEKSIQQCWEKISGQGSDYAKWVSTVPLTQVGVDAVWLNETALVNDQVYNTTILSYKEWEYEETMHSVLAVVVLILPVAACLLSAIWRTIRYHLYTVPVLRRLCTGINGHIIFPALGSSRHLVPLPLKIGYVPSRFLSIVIAFLITMNVAFSLMPFHNAWNLVQNVDRRSNVAYYFANRTGVLSFANIVLAVLFGARNNPLILLGKFSQTTSLAIHRWIARIATAQAIVHSVLFTVTYLWAGGFNAYSHEAARGYYTWGILATTALGICVGAAALPVRAYGYEIFLISHIILAILSLVGCWYHIILRYGKNWGYEVYLYLAFAFWAFDRLVRLVRIAVYNQRSCLSPGQVTAIPGSDILRVDIFPSPFWKFGPGQHSFLHFHTINGRLHKFWESHPFSVALWSSDGQDLKTAGTTIGENHYSTASVADNGTKASETSKIVEESSPSGTARSVHDRASHGPQSVTFFIKSTRLPSRSLSGLTDRLCAEASVNASFPVTVSTEGPYTHQSDASQFSDTTLLIGGGVGVTALLGHINSYLASQQHRASTEHSGDSSKDSETGTTAPSPKMVLAWSTNDSAFMRYIQAQLPLNDAEQLGLHFHFACTKSSDMNTDTDVSLATERLQIEALIAAEALLCGRLRKLTVISCGPAGMADKVRSAVALQAKQGSWVELVEEAFAW